jgi:hypothetical protein
VFLDRVGIIFQLGQISIWFFQCEDNRRKPFYTLVIVVF